MYKPHEVDEEMCEECMTRQAERLKDLDYALIQEHGGKAMVSELTNEQLINFVISRLEDSDASRENSMALVRLREAVVWLIEPNGWYRQRLAH